MRETILIKIKHYLSIFRIISLLFLFVHSPYSFAGDSAIVGVDIASVSGDILQIHIKFNNSAVAPKLFHTDNPARIALDFSGIKNGLSQKTIPINQGGATSIYIAEAPNRIRIIVNLIQSLPFDTKVIGNEVVLSLNKYLPSIQQNYFPPINIKNPPNKETNTTSKIASLIPQQVVSGFDFKRGEKGEGRILVYLANPNTIVNSKQEGGKVVINLLNTTLPNNLTKRLDISDFATPIKYIDTVSKNHETTISVITQNDLYDYSLFQSEGLLTIEFRPVTSQEKEVLGRARVKYTGDRLSLNFQEIEIRSVIAILAEFTGQNVVAGDDVTGTITLKLDDVPWDEALDFIMMTKGLEKFESGTVTLIAPVGKIKDYKEQQQDTAIVIEELDPLVTEYIKINYARAENFRNLLNGIDTGEYGSCGANDKPSTSNSTQQYSANSPGTSNLLPTKNGLGSNQVLNQSNKPEGQNDKFKILSSRGSAVVDARTNTLIVRETTKRLEEAKKLIRLLDVPVRQVMIESRIVIASNTFAKELGVRFGIAGSTPFGINVTPKVPVPGNTPTDNTINGTAIIDNALVDLAASNPYGALGMTLAKGADYVLNLELSALQDQGKGELVSNPRVMTTDRCVAKIKQGTQVPYTSGSAVGTPANIQFVNAFLELDVLPQITPSGSISMTLNITKDEPQPARTGEQPPIRTRHLETNVQVMDGETVVLGGVFEGIIANTISSVPFLADIPGIGFLFKKTINQDDKTELLIFITPKIIKDNAASN
jgi:type IV pilus assembly protein PilQ